MSESEYTVGVVRAATVVFTRADTAGISPPSEGVDPVVATDDDGTVIASIDADGLLTYRPDRASEIAIASGVTVRGIRALYPNGDAYDASTYPERAKPMLMLRAVDGGYAVLEHESLTITEPTERITNAYGAAAVMIGPDAVQCFWSVNATRRWRCPHWGVWLGSNASFASPNATITQAVERIAADLAILKGGLIS